MANLITAIASRAVAKNSLLKQTDVTTSGKVTSVSTISDAQQNIGGGRGILGNQTNTTIITPDSAGTPGTPGTPGTITNPSENQMSAEAWKKFTAKETAEEKQIRYGREQAEGRREGYTPPTEGTSGTSGSSETTSDFEMDQESVKGMGNLDLRADIRAEKILNRQDRQAERREDRFERKYNPDGTKRTAAERKEKRKSQRFDRAQSNIQRQKNVQNLIADRRALRDLQRDQGGFGSGNLSEGNRDPNPAIGISMFIISP